MNYKKYLFLVSPILILLVFNVALASFTSSGAVHCWGTRSDDCFESSSVSERWVSCASGEYLRAVGIAGDGNTVTRIGASCYRLPSTQTSIQFCGGSSFTDCNISYNDSTPPDNMEDWAVCPLGWLLKGIGFKTDGSGVNLATAKCFNPLNSATSINNMTCNGSCGVDPDEDAETYVECIALRAVLSSVGFSGDGAGEIRRAAHVCVDAPLPASTPTPISPTPTIAPGTGSVIGWTMEAITFDGVETSVNIAVGAGSPVSYPTDSGNGYFYERAGIANGTNVTVSIPSSAIPSSHTLDGYKYCYGPISGPVCTAGPYTSSNLVTLPIIANQALTIRWRFSLSGAGASPSPFAPLPTLPPPPIVNIVGPPDPVSGPLDAYGRMRVTLDWTFSDPPNFAFGGSGSQNRYRIQIQDQDQLDSNLPSADLCRDNSATNYDVDCMEKVSDFRTNGFPATATSGLDNYNNENVSSGVTSRTVSLERNKNYRWRVQARSSNGNRTRWSTSAIFSTGSSPLIPTPTPIVPTPTPLIDLEIDNADNPVGNPLIKDEGDPITIDWVGSALISCQAQRALPEPPEDSDRTNWWDSDTDGNNFSILNTNAVPGNVSGSRTFNTPTIATGGPLTRLLRYIIQCTPDGVTNIGDSEYVRVINIPIASFSANPSLVKSEQISQLTWRCDNSNYYTIDHGISTDAPCAGTCTGTYDVYPEDSTTYTLSCKNSQAGTDVVRIKQVTVQVGTIIEGQ